MGAASVDKTKSDIPQYSFMKQKAAILAESPPKRQAMIPNSELQPPSIGK
jgi:hypothetical protein